VTTQSTQDAGDPLAAAANRIRDAGKWLIAAAAAVGAALIAGSQLSSIGKLNACTARSEQCLRLPVSLLGAIIGLVSIAYIMWSAGRLLLPVEVTITDLANHWDASKREWADAQFFKENPAYLGYENPSELEHARTDAWTRLTDAEDAAEPTSERERAIRKSNIAQARKEFDELQDRTMTVTSIAQYQLLKDEFSRFSRKLLPAAALAAFGVVLFAWAANPPSPSAPSVTMKGADLVLADLRQANLKGVDLSGANLSYADLRGAQLDGANLKNVIWDNTQCPDGTNSDNNNHTCLGHLNP
jgi:Pentapeptide repeats (8 copies)